MFSVKSMRMKYTPQPGLMNAMPSSHPAGSTRNLADIVELMGFFPVFHAPLVRVELACPAPEAGALSIVL
jgi:hypothetical protein